MIIYGTNSKQLAKETLFEKCPNCGAQHSVELFVFQKYAHVFWIPFFPLNKYGATQCNQCKQVLNKTKWPSYWQAQYDTLKAQTHTPIWTFVGVALIGVLITWIIIDDKRNEERNARLILSPEKGDILEIKTSEDQYTLYKIDKVEGDSVFLLINSYETNMPSGLDDLKRKGENAYSEFILPVLKSELRNMLGKGEILNIDRE